MACLYDVYRVLNHVSAALHNSSEQEEYWRLVIHKSAISRVYAADIHNSIKKQARSHCIWWQKTLIQIETLEGNTKMKTQYYLQYIMACIRIIVGPRAF